jgi:hypothetical protein
MRLNRDNPCWFFGLKELMGRNFWFVIFFVQMYTLYRIVNALWLFRTAGPVGNSGKTAGREQLSPQQGRTGDDSPVVFGLRFLL